ncbi:MAG: right-handed parallel beta-helix repeat-containing protein [Acetobacteraceae bacterium]|nr:right-handed parallel beta-helix repeat-containing protein [Acetobacteraceae bacterium]
MTILTVGQGQEFSTLHDAVAASQNGDVIQVQAGNYFNDFAEVNTKITIEGVGGIANFIATEAPPNGKAILTTDTDVTIDHLAFSGAQDGDNNGAGIRYQGGNLVITNSWFHDNQDGLLANADPNGSITIDNSEFDHNGAGDGQSHNIYVGEVGKLTVTNSYLHDASVGHELKSRALVDVIENNRIADGVSGTASYDIDLPDGGDATIANNVIEKGLYASNTPMIHFGGETATPYANSSLEVGNNVFLNDNPKGILLFNQTDVAGQFSDNQAYGFPSTIPSIGPISDTGTTVLTSEPDLDTAHPFTGATVTQDFAGPDTLTLSLSEDAFEGDAQFIVRLDGEQLGGPQSISASHAAGQTEDFTFHGNFGSGPHVVQVTYLNDLYGGDAQHDRNMYVDGISLNGAQITGDIGEMLSQGTAAFAAPSAPASDNGEDTLVLKLSEDAYQGDADFVVSIDGNPVTGVLSTDGALASDGASRTVTLHGRFGAGPHDVGVTFVNDCWGGDPSHDRNLYVDSVEYDGNSFRNTQIGQYLNGTLHFTVDGQGSPVETPTVATSSGPPSADTLVLNLSEDAFAGDAQFIVSVDGQQISGPTSVTALRSAGQSQNLTYTGVFGSGPHHVSVSFINDAYEGPGEDRNLYLNSITFDGQLHQEDNAALYSNGSATFVVSQPPSPQAAASTMPSTTAAPAMAVTLSLSEDAWNGDANFSLALDGEVLQMGAVDGASHSLGQTDFVSLQLPAGLAPGAHDLSVSFTNDAWGGSPDTDRNLYVDAASINGVSLPDFNAALFTNGARHLLFATGDAEVMLTGGDGDDLLLGGAGPTIMDAGAGTNRLWSGAGADEFRFHSADVAQDFVYGFKIGTDSIHLDPNSSVTPEAVVAGASADVSGNTILHIGPQHDVTLVGISPTQVTAALFN